ncbi:lectizyme [Eupeodes corollae]|uniref:lectizyme n=1 Tax=Eupeodes corollae TaxID=290404 RepID=UPI0024920F05|nr:lectizyme [Eupeodes corollae]
MKVLIVCFALTAVVSVGAFDLYPLIRPQFSSGDIISGTAAEPGEAPFIVSLKSSSHFCAGSIIDEHWILTAAHCLVYNKFKVVAGLHKRSDESQVQIRSVSLKNNSIQHELYSGGVGPNDIGLIYLDEPLDLSEISRSTGKPLVSKVQLPSRQFSQLGDGVLFGWGIDNSNNIPNTLQKLETQIIGYDRCKRLLPMSAPLDPVNICSHNEGTIASACNGDSGGPLVKFNGKVVEQIGIVSWGYTPCTSTRYPSVYTHTDAFLSWISQSIEGFVPANKQ